MRGWFLQCIFGLLTLDQQSISEDTLSIAAPHNNQYFYSPASTEVVSIFLKFRIEVNELSSRVIANKSCVGSDVIITMDGIELTRNTVESGNYSYDDITMAGVGKHDFRIALVDAMGMDCTSAVSHFRVVETRLQVPAIAPSYCITIKSTLYRL